MYSVLNDALNLYGQSVGKKIEENCVIHPYDSNMT